MTIDKASIDGVKLSLPGAAEFLALPFGNELAQALPFSIVARNTDRRAIAFLGIRFDMLSPRARAYSVVHYADTLRHPERADLIPGASRFVCAEPAYTDLVLGKRAEFDARARMNLENLQKALGIRASVDCVAFDDGEFRGRDSLGAFARLERERQEESRFVGELLACETTMEGVLTQALNSPVCRRFAKPLHQVWCAGGTTDVAALAREHRLRIKLWR